MHHYMKPDLKSFNEFHLPPASCQYTGSLTITFRQAAVSMNEKPAGIVKVCKIQENDKIIKLG